MFAKVNIWLIRANHQTTASVIALFNESESEETSQLALALLEVD